MAKKIRKRRKPVIELYEKLQNGQYDPFTDFRDDIAFNLRNGTDIVIEETGLHCDNPFDRKPEDIAKWSEEHDEMLTDCLTDYSKYYQDVLTDLKQSAKPRYELYTAVDGFDRTVIDRRYEHMNIDERYDKIISDCQIRLNNLRKNGKVDDNVEVVFRRANVFNIRMLRTNFDLNDPVNKLYSDRLSLTNSVTVLQNVYENGSDKAPYSHNLRTYTIGEALELSKNQWLKGFDKTVRPCVLGLTNGQRVVADEKYLHWSGFQMFDIDLKYSKDFKHSKLDASDVRDILFDKIRHYPWLISINLSSSGKGLHVWTKVSRMHHIYQDDEDNIEIAKYWYRISYYQKFAALAYILNKYCDVTDVYDCNRKEDVLDNSMAQPGQLMALSYDPEAKYNSNFVDLYPAFKYHVPPESGIELKDWLTCDEMNNIFSSWFADFDISKSIFDGQEVRFDNVLKVNADTNYKLNDLKQIQMDMLDKGEKYRIRYRVANTIIALYGNTPEAIQLVHHLLQSEETNTTGQINSIISTAVHNKKSPDQYMIKKLQGLGLKLKVDEESKEQVREQEMTRAESTLKHSNYIFRSIAPDSTIQLGDSDYLGSKKSEILNSFVDHKLNLIESPPNTGKTTLFKLLAKSSRVCMVSPFTSTIESKVVTDAEINEYFDVYYGNRPVQEVFENEGRSAVMTFDKFSKLGKKAYDLFDYIVIDESHLLFTSTYRLGVVSQTVESIREHLISEVKTEINAFSEMTACFQNLQVVNVEQESKRTVFIMMTGTVTCEADYFSHYGLLNYIRIAKQHPFEKKVKFHFCQTKETKMIAIYKAIANAIEQGKKVLHPSNSGDSYAKQTTAAVEHILGRDIKWEYYKRANADESFLQEINTDCTTKDIDLLFSTDYLSVGIDIEDTSKYEVIFNTDFTAEEVEQFNNRLRRTNIHCHMYCDVLSEDGFIKPNTLSTRQVSYSLNQELMNIFEDEKLISKLQLHIHDKQGYYAILGELFSRYFTLSNTGRIKFVKAALEIEQFEKQYREIARGLLYIKTSLANKFNYDVSFTTVAEELDAIKERFATLVQEVNERHKLDKSNRFVEVIKFASDDNNYVLLSNKAKLRSVRYDTPIEEDEYPLHIGYESNADDLMSVLSYNRVYKFVLDQAIKIALRLRKFYNEQAIHAILDLCMKGELISYTELDRYIRLVHIVNDDKRNQVTKYTRDLLQIAYRHIDVRSTEATTMDRLDYDFMLNEMRTYVHENITILTSKQLKSERRLDEINNRLNGLIDIMFKKRVSKATVSIAYRKVFRFNSPTMLARVQNDKVFNELIVNTIDALDYKESMDFSSDHFTELDFGIDDIQIEEKPITDKDLLFNEFA